MPDQGVGARCSDDTPHLPQSLDAQARVVEPDGVLDARVSIQVGQLEGGQVRAARRSVLGLGPTALRLSDAVGRRAAREGRAGWPEGGLATHAAPPFARTRAWNRRAAAAPLVCLAVHAVARCRRNGAQNAAAGTAGVIGRRHGGGFAFLRRVFVAAPLPPRRALPYALTPLCRGGRGEAARR